MTPRPPARSRTARSPGWSPASPTAPGERRLRLEVEGVVQGVGFRPFLFRLARELGLLGEIRNTPAGVLAELEGEEPRLRELLRTVEDAPPPAARVRAVRASWHPPAGAPNLQILSSENGGRVRTGVLPDLATCQACLRDIGILPSDNPDPRRRGYAFTNCTECGPRYSIIRRLPYDRCNTSMEAFDLCLACRAEYEEPGDRRFHAQPTACPFCGPRLWLEAANGGTLPPGADTDPMGAVAQAVLNGRTVAVQGLGGFHLVTDATDDDAVRRLRERKHRPTKPLALMVRDLAMARWICRISADEEALLRGPEAPVVLLPRSDPQKWIAPAVAPGSPELGIMLPYTPLHHLLMARLDRPVVATSGNRSEEPLCITAEEARVRLSGIADLFLFHDRPIERPVDDSVARVLDGAPRLLRRARGYAPGALRLPGPTPPLLAVGAHLKCVVAVAREREVFLGQHLGDLGSAEGQALFEGAVADLLRLHEIAPEVIVHDLHPDYHGTRWALAEARRRRDAGAPPARLIAVQHHHAHLVACLLDNEVPGPAFGVVWDGTGAGPDGTVWGGELLLGDASGYRRAGALRSFRLPGGDVVAREPRRAAFALLWDAFGEEAPERLEGTGARGAFDARELRVLAGMMAGGIQAPWTTSAGRLFDGVASLLGLRQHTSHEGEAAMALEWIVDAGETAAYPVSLTGTDTFELDWRPTLDALLADIRRGISAPAVAARFHNGLAHAIAEAAERVGMEAVALTGGCFQNRVLAERAAAALRRGGHRPLLHRRVPPNDGGIALGQAAIAQALLANSRGARS